jgi:hypothetical protein
LVPGMTSARAEPMIAIVYLRDFCAVTLALAG